jgi:hypothetical protein
MLINTERNKPQPYRKEEIISEKVDRSDGDLVVETEGYALPLVYIVRTGCT